jgi:hypothetical protein
MDARGENFKLMDAFFVTIDQRGVEVVLLILKKKLGNELADVYPDLVFKDGHIPDDPGLVHEKRGTFKPCVQDLDPCNPNP